MAPYGRSFRGAGHVCERLAQGRYSESLLGSAKSSAHATEPHRKSLIVSENETVSCECEQLETFSVNAWTVQNHTF